MAISVDNTYFTNYSVDANNAAADRVTGKLESMETDEETLDACKQFEAYMIQQMFKSMQESAKALTEDDEEDDSGQYVDMFSDIYLQSIAESMVNSGQGLGMAEQLYDSIIKNNS